MTATNPPADPLAHLAHDDFTSFTHFGGFDWGIEHHQLCIVDKQGAVLVNLCVSNDADGWRIVQEKLKLYPHLAIAIETSSGPAVERLLDLGITLFPMQPKAAERYRDRKAPSGVKSDELDAWAFADALRTDGHGWRRLLPLDPLTAEIRILCRDEIALIEQRTALVLQLKAALHEYHPVALDAFDDWTHPATWDFVLAFPSPDDLHKAGKRKWEKFLHTHKLYRPETAAKRLELFAKALQFVNPNKAVNNAKTLLATTIARQLRALQPSLDEYRARIQRLFNDHPDHDCFGSLPGAGPKLAPRLLAEFGPDRSRFQTFQSVQCFAGTAPVTQTSGKSRHVSARWACNKILRGTVHLWADLSRASCAWAQAFYQQKKRLGKSHATALRCLGNRWLKILWTMWQNHTPYNEALHTQNQVKHGSWVIALTQPTPAAPTR
jgi:transposase